MILTGFTLLTLTHMPRLNLRCKRASAACKCMVVVAANAWGLHINASHALVLLTALHVERYASICVSSPHVRCCAALFSSCSSLLSVCRVRPSTGRVQWTPSSRRI